MYVAASAAEGLSRWGVYRELPMAAAPMAKTTSFYRRNPLLDRVSLVRAKPSFSCFCALAGDDVFSVTSATQFDVDYLGQSTKGDLNVKSDHLDSFGNFTLSAFWYRFPLSSPESFPLLFTCRPWGSISLGGSNWGSCQGGSWRGWGFASPLGYPGTLILLPQIHMLYSATPTQLLSSSLIIQFQLLMGFLFLLEFFLNFGSMYMFLGAWKIFLNPSTADYLDYKFHHFSFWIKLANLLVWSSFLFVPPVPVLQCKSFCLTAFGMSALVWSPQLKAKNRFIINRVLMLSVIFNCFHVFDGRVCNQ